MRELPHSLRVNAPDVVLVVGGGGKRLVALLVGAHVRLLPGVRADVHLADVGRGERAVTPLKWALEWPLTCRKVLYYCI